jgi:hypothetical protein
LAPIEPPRVAVFVSPHGFGHAARASAVMEALHRRTGALFELFTTAPPWFFEESVGGLYQAHPVVTDVGFFQVSALAFDVGSTVSAVEAMVPFDEGLVAELADRVRRTGCRFVLCDIAPLGIAVAERAGVPSVLVQNFTWPWLYEPLLDEAPGLRPLAAELDRWFGRATHHLLAEPFCTRDPRAHGTVLPVSRPARRTREDLRGDMGLSPDQPVVVLTMGGFTEEMPFLDGLRAQADTTFLVTGGARTEVRGNVRLFDQGTRLYMPDLVRTADAVVAKLGYSTVAEVWREGRPLAVVTRADFRETAPLRDWVAARLPGFEIPGADFAAGEWIEAVPSLLSGPLAPRQPFGGAEQVADYVVDKVL